MLERLAQRQFSKHGCTLSFNLMMPSRNPEEPSNYHARANIAIANTLSRVMPKQRRSSVDAILLRTHGMMVNKHEFLLRNEYGI